ncbi:MAG: peptide deformylase [Myxococcota bacterium]|nr:peptide deformylase [Myxococcota bacterium]
MSLLKIAQIGHPILRTKAQPLTLEELASPEIQLFIDNLVETMRDARGAGLAANQVHKPIQICAIEVQDNPRYPYKPNIPLTILVNPTIKVLNQDTFQNFEGCLSVSNLRGIVERYLGIEIQFWNRKGRQETLEVRGLTAGTYQHEVDHLEGRIFLDRVSDSTSLCTWQHFETYHRENFEKQARSLVEKYGS